MTTSDKEKDMIDKNYRLLIEIYNESKNFNRIYIRRCVISIVFLKYINDYNYQKYQQYAIQYSGNPELVKRKMNRERFILPSEANFKNLYNEIGTNDVYPGEIINAGIETLELANKFKLNGVFRGVDFNNPITAGASEGDWRSFLIRLINNVYKMNLVPSLHENLAQDIFEQILLQWPIEVNDTSERFFAPFELRKLLIRLMRPQAGDRIYDPACNIGTLLSEAAHAVIDQEGNISNDYALHGQEYSEEIASMARINMFIHELDDAKITISDPINDPILISQGQLMEFDLLMSNLPWNINNWGYDTALSDKLNRFEWGVPPKIKGDLAYIQHMIKVASEKGRIGVIIPHGVLFREGNELLIRKGIVTNNLLEAIIALPSNLLYSTKQSCAIMLLRKGRGGNKNILFIDASKEYKTGKRQNELREEDLNRIVSTYISFKNNRDAINAGYSAVITPEQINSNDYNLNVSRYVLIDDSQELHVINPDAIQKEIEMLKEELIEIRVDIKRNLQKVNNINKGLA